MQGCLIWSIEGSHWTTAEEGRNCSFAWVEIAVFSCPLTLVSQFSSLQTWLGLTPSPPHPHSSPLNLYLDIQPWLPQFLGLQIATELPCWIPLFSTLQTQILDSSVSTITWVNPYDKYIYLTVSISILLVFWEPWYLPSAFQLLDKHAPTASYEWHRVFVWVMLTWKAEGRETDLGSSFAFLSFNSLSLCLPHLGLFEFRSNTSCKSHNHSIDCLTGFHNIIKASYYNVYFILYSLIIMVPCRSNST